MRPRVGAAALAVFGGLLVVAAVFTPSWWGGPIHIAGRVIHNKTVHISMLRATGCNAGDGTCMGLDVGTAFRLTGILTLLLAMVTAAVTAAMAHRWWRRSPMAAVYARVALLGTALTVMGASFFLGMLPDRFAEIPVGFSPYGFFAGTAAMALAAVLVLRRPAAARAEAEPVDVRELLSTDMLRPAMLGPEPKMGRMGRHGPGAGAGPEEPSFAAPAAPRFRPLYEVQAMPPPPSGAYVTGPSGAYAPIAPPPPSGAYPSASGAYAPVGGYPSASAHYPPASQAYPQAAPSQLPLATPLPRQTYPSATAPGLGVGVGVDPGASSTIERELSMSDAIETANLSPVTDVGEALPRAESEASWRVDPPLVAAERPLTEPPDPGFDQPTAPSQMSMAAMLAQQVSEAEAQEAGSPFDLSDELSEGATRGGRSATEVSAEMEDGLDEALEAVAAEATGSATSTTVEVGRDSRTGANDSGVFLHTESAASISRAPVSRPPTATTSASLAALARLSKPALITMAPSAARKVSSAKAGEPAVAAAVAVAVAPGAAPAPSPSTAPVGAGTGAGEGSTPACPHCDAPMGWADKHLRYYCGTCRMYF
jgi:hypothetical protein